ncbi:DUF6098 family protein [Streptomyces pactum]|uniref:DUF6098 family protein n=1 Tax=Streptomyces pactum TaxID=68249 RepID=UPI0037036B4E
MPAAAEMPVLARLDDVVDLVRRTREPLYVRWSKGPQADLGSTTSTDDLTGVPLPGLSVNALKVEPWWGDRPLRLWVARRLYDYCHLRREKGPGVRPWVLTGRELARGPDNEPLLAEVAPVAWIDAGVIDEAQEEVCGQRGAWGPLRRATDAAPPPGSGAGAGGAGTETEERPGPGEPGVGPGEGPGPGEAGTGPPGSG